MGVMVSSSHVVSAAPCPSGGRLLTLFPCSSVRSLSQETVLHRLLQCESFPQAAALHKPPQHGSFPWRCSPSGRGCSSMGPPWGHKPCQQTCFSVGSLPRATGGYLLHHGPPWTARGQPASPWSFIMSCKGRLAAPTFRAPPPPPSSLTLVSAELFLSHRLTPLSSLPFYQVLFFSSLS